MKRLTWLLLCLWIPVAGQCISAEEAADRAARLEMEFIDRIVEEYGYYKLATKTLTKMAEDPANPKGVRAMAYLKLSDLVLKVADREKDPKQREEWRKKAERYLEQFQKLGGGKGVTTAGMKIADLLRKRALRIKAQAEIPGLSEQERALLIDKAAKLFDQAIERYDALKKQLYEQYDKATQKDGVTQPELDRLKAKYGEPWYEKLRTMRMKALMYRAGGEKRTSLLKKLIEEIDNFTGDFFGFGYEFFGNLMKASCQKDAGQFKEAMKTLDALYKDMKDRQILNRLPDVVRNIFIQKIEVHIAWGKDSKNQATATEHYTKALKDIERFFQRYEKIARAQAGRNLDIRCYCLKMKAQALAGLGKYGEALNTVSWIYEHGSPAWRAEAAKLIGTFGAKAKAAEAFFITGKRYLAEAEHLLKTGKKSAADNLFRSAIRVYTKGLAEAKEQEIRKFGTTAWYHIGIAFFRLEQYLEADIAFEQLASLAKRLDDKEMMKKGLLLRTKALSRARKEIPPKAETARRYFEKKWLNAMIDFVKAFPREQESFSMYFFIGEAFRKQGQFDKAMSYYNKVPKGSKLYYDARFRIAMSLWNKYKSIYKKKDKQYPEGEKERFLSSVITAFREFLPICKRMLHSERVDEKVKKRLRSQWAGGELILAQAQLERSEMLTALGKEKEARKVAREVLSTLQGFEKKHKERKSFTSVYLIRIKAYERLGDVKGAEKVLNDIRKTNNRKTLLQALGLVGNLCLSVAEKTTDPVEKKRLTDRAATYFEELIQIDPKMGAEIFIWLGDRLYTTHQYAQAIARFEAALPKLPKDAKSETLRQVIRYKLARCYHKIGNYDRALQIIEDLLKRPGWEKDWNLNVLEVRVQMDKAKTMKGTKKTNIMRNVLEKLAKMGRKVKEFSDEWYAARMMLVEAYVILEDYKKAVSAINLLDGLYGWGNQQNRNEVASLLEKYLPEVKKNDEKAAFEMSKLVKSLRKPKTATSKADNEGKRRNAETDQQNKDKNTGSNTKNNNGETEEKK